MGREMEDSPIPVSGRASGQPPDEVSADLEDILASGFIEFEQLANRSGSSKLLFLEGLLFSRHAPEIFEIAQRLGNSVEAVVAYVAEGLVGNDHDIYSRKFGRRWTGTSLLKRLRRQMRVEARIVTCPVVAKRVVAAAQAQWANQRTLLTDSPASIRSLTYNDVPLGAGILSSYYSFKRSTNFVPTDLLDDIERDYINAATVFERSRALIAAERPTAVCTFNGRTKYGSPVVLASQAMGVPVFFHERGGASNKYLFAAHSPHDFAAIGAKMNHILVMMRSGRLDESLGSKFFLDARAGRTSDRPSFTGDQSWTATPMWRRHEGELLAAFYTSSEDEFFALPGFRPSDVFETQFDAAKWFAGFATSLGMSPVIRIHPNDASAKTGDLNRWRQLERSGAVVLYPDDPSSSYQLLDESDLVGTLLSTMGAEAAFAGKSVVYLGNALGAEIGIGYKLLASDLGKPPADVLAQIHTRDDRTRALAFGYYRSMYGAEFKTYSPIDLHTGKIAGRPISLVPELPEPLESWYLSLNRLKKRLIERSN